MVLSSQDKSAKCLPSVLGFHVLSCVSVRRSERISQRARTRASQINCLLTYQRLPDILIRHFQYGFSKRSEVGVKPLPGGKQFVQKAYFTAANCISSPESTEASRIWTQHRIPFPTNLAISHHGPPDQDLPCTGTGHGLTRYHKEDIYLPTSSTLLPVGPEPAEQPMRASPVPVPPRKCCPVPASSRPSTSLPSSGHGASLAQQFPIPGSAMDVRADSESESASTQPLTDAQKLDRPVMPSRRTCEPSVQTRAADWGGTSSTPAIEDRPGWRGR